MVKNENTLTGFQRVNAAYHNCPHPELIFKWCTGVSTENEIPELVRVSLIELDSLAATWPQIKNLEDRIGNNHPALTRQLLGLDFDPPQLRLRVAIARAMAATWRYSDIFCDWRDARKTGKKVISDSRNTFEIINNNLGPLLKTREERGWLSSRHTLPGKRLENSLAEIQDIISGLEIWIDGEDTRMKNFPANAPRLFLVVRLSEIYACFSGLIPTGHFTRRETTREDSPDQLFGSYLKIALKVLEYPSVETGLDDILRDIAIHITGNGHSWGCLVNRRSKLIDYPYFPSIDLMNGLNCFSVDQL